MIGNRLKLAREAAGMSLRDLEAAMDRLVSAQAIGKYERNEMMPSSKVLLALGKALKVSPEYLISQRALELTGIDFRKAPQTSAKEERAVERAILDRVERYIELEDLLPDERHQWQLPDRQEFFINSIEDVERAADCLREIWLLGIDPIPVMAELLEDKGVKVISLAMSDQVSGSKALVAMGTDEQEPVIVVNGRHNGERQRFTLAHELAHLVLRFEALSDLDQEKAADRFAGAFLMAREMMERLLGRHRKEIALGELVELKSFFKVSIAALAVRCAQLGLISKAAYGRLWGHIRSHGWNSQASDEPNCLEPESPRRMERICMRAVAEGLVSLAKAAELVHLSARELDARLTAQVA